MRVTKEIRKYIHKQIVAKAQSKLDTVNNAIKAEEDSMDEKVENINQFLRAWAERLKEEVVKLSKASGLTTRDTLHFSLNVNCDDFVETHTGYLGNKPRYHNNKRYCELWEDRRKLVEKIDDSVAGIVFKLEAGANRGEIEEMLAAIKF